jgi:transposase
MKHNACPSNVCDGEWAFVAPYLPLVTKDSARRTHRLREVFNGLRWLVRAGALWRMMPDDSHRGKPSPNRPSGGRTPGCSKPWSAVCGCCCAWWKGARRGHPAQTMATEWAMIGRNANGEAQCIRPSIPWATCWPCIAPLRMATIGCRWRRCTAPGVPPGKWHLWIKAIPDTDRGQAVADNGIPREGVERPGAKQGFMLPLQWVVEASFGWAARFRGRARIDERWLGTLAGLHVLTYAIAIPTRFVALIVQVPNTP